MRIRPLIALAVGLMLYNTCSIAQNLETDTTDLYDLNLEELMNINIVSASKKSENLFEAPFSASVITQEEIKKAGCTSLMEAFRLMPGLIVREQTNGNFDIHIRGLDNVPPSSVMVNAANTTTLVMIDNRPVYNYLQGGTFWETLPVDLNDVERIEVVRGPSSAMYGPNAVSGVIHIITRKTSKDGIYALANSMYGTSNTMIGNASIGYQTSSKFNFIVSGNYQKRDRESVSYYRIKQNDYTSNPNELPIINPQETGDLRYPHPKVAMNKLGINAFINYMPTDRINVNAALGLQDSEVQNSYAENLLTPLSTNTSNTKYADLKLSVYGLSAQFSYLGGTQDVPAGVRGAKYDFSTIDNYVEYAIKIKNITLKPGYNFRRALYDDTKYWNIAIKEGVISGKNEIVTNAFSVRSEYRLLKEKLRLFGGVRFDKFNYPDKLYFSYQLAGNYNFNDKHLLRIVQSKANRSPFVYDTYIDVNLPTVVDIATPPYALPVIANVTGNKNLQLVTSQMTEIGYRARLAKNLQLDWDLFMTKTTNYTDLIQSTTDITTIPFRTSVHVENLPLKVYQYGSTISIHYILNNLQLKPFVTLQTTQLKDYSPYYYYPEYNPNTNYLKTEDKKHEGTPAIYGGAYLNYQINNKININLNPYFLSSQTFYHRNYIQLKDGKRGFEKMDAKLILNARVSFKLLKQLDLFVSGKNILGDTSREFYKSDRIGPNFLAGLNFEL